MLRQSPLMHKRPANSRHHTCLGFQPRDKVGRSSFNTFCPLAYSPPLEQIFSTTSQGPTVSEIAHPHPQLLLLSSWRKWTVLQSQQLLQRYLTHMSGGLCSSRRKHGLMSICKGTQHFSCVACKSKQCPGLWRREAKLQILDPGLEVSLSISYTALNT